MEIHHKIQLFFLAYFPSLLVFLCCAEEISRAEFPDGFLFGTATSAYQASMDFFFNIFFLVFCEIYAYIYQYGLLGRLKEHFWKMGRV